MSMPGKFIIIIIIAIYYHRGSLPGVNRPWNEVDQSRLFSADVQNDCSYTSPFPV